MQDFLVIYLARNVSESGKVYYLQYISETEEPIVKFVSLEEDQVLIRFASDNEENGMGFIMFYMFMSGKTHQV